MDENNNFDWLDAPPAHILAAEGCNIDPLPPTAGKAVDSITDILGAIEDGSITQVLEAPRPETQETQSERLALDPGDGEIDIYTSEPQPRDWLIQGVLVSGKSAILTGLGGTSKTQLAIQMAVAIALGESFMGRTTQAGATLLLLGEEDRAEISRRFSAVVRSRGYSPAQIARIKEHVKAHALVGVDMRVTTKVGKEAKATGRIDDVIAAVNAQGSVRLVVLDHLSLIHGGEHNAREDASETARLVNKLAHETGATVLVLAHAPKSAAGAEESTQNMISGSGAFGELTRTTLVLATMRVNEAKDLGINNEARDHYASLIIAKANYAKGSQTFWFQRNSYDEVGLLEHVNLSTPTPESKKNAKASLESCIIEFVKAHPGQYSKNKLRDTQAGKDRRFKVCARDLMATTEDLLARNMLQNREPTADERAKYGHSKQVKQVLDVWRPKGQTA